MDLASSIASRGRQTIVTNRAVRSQPPKNYLNPRLYFAFAFFVGLVNLSAFGCGFQDTCIDGICRGPYLQSGTSTSMIVRWRTEDPEVSQLAYGTSANALDTVVYDEQPKIDHEFLIAALAPDTRYHYSIGSPKHRRKSETFQFETAPVVGQDDPIRIWVLGDSGTGDGNQKRVRDAYHRFSEGDKPDVWLMLGDNAYNDGTDTEFEKALFEIYTKTLPQVPLWLAYGNHDAKSALAKTQAGTYFDIFSLPRAAWSSGASSGTEAYYSFNYGNVHFVSLDSAQSDLDSDGPMLRWLEDDLAANFLPWVIAYWHHPPYSKGSHDSDSEQHLISMRQNAVPILERYGVDLVLTGHSHSYERSAFIHGHYGDSKSFKNDHIINGGNGHPDGRGMYAKSSAGPGTVYAVVGASGKLSDGPLDHPIMVRSTKTFGSLVVDVEGDTLRARYITDQAQVIDEFFIVHDAGGT